MAISFRCPKCGAILRAPIEYAGGQGRCAACAASVRIPKDAPVLSKPEPASRSGETEPVANPSTGDVDETSESTLGHITVGLSQRDVLRGRLRLTNYARAIKLRLSKRALFKHGLVIVFALSTLSALLLRGSNTGVSREDRLVVQQLIGTWTAQGYNSDGGYRRLLNFHSNGSLRFDGEGSVPMANGIIMSFNIPTVRGKWKIEDRKLLLSLDRNVLPIGTKDGWITTRIRSLDTSRISFGQSSWPPISGQTYRRSD